MFKLYEVNLLKLPENKNACSLRTGDVNYYNNYDYPKPNVGAESFIPSLQACFIDSNLAFASAN